MIEFDILWLGWSRAALASSILLVVGSIAVTLTRAPVRRTRLVLITLGAASLAPLLGLTPGFPCWSPPIRQGGVSDRDRGTSIVASDAPLGADRAPSRPADLPVWPRRISLEQAEGIERTLPIPAFATHERVVDLRRLALAAHLGGAAGWLSWWGIGLIALARVARSGRPVDRTTRDRFAAVAGPAGGRVRLLACDRLAAPVTFTWRRPTILLPVGLNEGEDDELRFALAHEWMHVIRCDYHSWTLASLTGLWLGINPLYWLLRRELRLGQDFLADDHAAAAGSPAECAAYLVRLARARRDHASFPLPALGVAGRRSHLVRRVAMLLADRAPHATRCRPAWTAAMAILAAALVLATAAIRLDAAPPGTIARTPIPLDGPKPPTGREWVGRIVDQATGQPIAGAAVRVEISTSREPRTTDLTRLRDVSATTPADGSYRFTLTPEEQADRFLYINLVVNEGTHLRYFGGYSYAMLLKNIDLGERPFFEKLALTPGVPVTGVVVQPDGRPAARVMIRGYAAPPASESSASAGTFSDCRTDTEGKFRLLLPPSGLSALWMLPQRFAPIATSLKDLRGDLGRITLFSGQDIKGRVLDASGKPVGGVYVAAVRDRGPDATNMEFTATIGENIRRAAMTLDDGTFTLGPFAPGWYRVQPDATWLDPATYDDAVNRPDRPLADVFLSHDVKLEGRGDPKPLVFQPSPHVTVTAQVYDSKGEKRRGFQVTLAGRIDGKWWSAHTRPTPDGFYKILAPRGLERAGLGLTSNEHGSLMFRTTPGGALSPNPTVPLGTLDHDVSGIEIIRYVSPTILIKATDQEGKGIKGFRAAVIYSSPLGDAANRERPKDQIRTDIPLEGPQEDGRFRTRSLPVGYEFEVIAAAEAFKPASRLVKLPEGKVEEVAFVLEPK